MSAWRGLTRPEQHRVTSIPDMAYCVVCGDAIDGRSLTEAIFAVQRVRALHHITVDCVDSREGPCDVEHCAECGYIPLDGEMCPTIRAIEGEL